MTAPTFVPPAADRTLDTPVVVAGLTLGWVLGLAGGLLDAGRARDFLWVISSVGLTTAAVVLAVRTIGRNTLFAAGAALLAIGEALIHVQGPGGPDAFAAATYSYLPALVLVAVSGWGPVWSRLTAAAAGIVFGSYAAAYLGGADVEIDGQLAGAGYGLLALTLIGWTWHLVRGPRTGA